MSLPIFIEVDGAGPYDPLAGGNTVTVPDLAGKEFYITKTGYGPYDLPLWEVLPGGTGWRLTGGAVFLIGEKFQIIITNSVAAGDIPSGNYSNGFNLLAVMDVLKQRIGWLQNYDTTPVVDADNMISQSGRYFQDFHASVTPNNINSTMDISGASDAQFNNKLRDLTRASVAKCLNAVFNVPEFIQQGMIFETRELSKRTEVTDNAGKFAAYYFKLPPSDEYSLRLEAVELGFTEDVSFPLYLFKEGKKSPLTSITVNAIAYESTIVSFSNIVLNYFSQTTKGGGFYFGYFADDLGTAKALRVDNVVQNCNTWFLSTFIKANVTGALDFERTQWQQPYQPEGINIQFSLQRDHTNRIVKYQHLFDEAIGLAVAASVLELVIYNTRSNGTERALREQTDRTGLQVDLTGTAPISEAPRTTGLRQKQAKELTRLRRTFFPPAKNIIVRSC